MSHSEVCQDQDSRVPPLRDQAEKTVIELLKRLLAKVSGLK
jgi:hypothetical protein